VRQIDSPRGPLGSAFDVGDSVRPVTPTAIVTGDSAFQKHKPTKEELLSTASSGGEA